MVDEEKRLNELDGTSWVKESISFFSIQFPPRKEMKKLHPATFPAELAEKFIKFFTRKGQWVLDPFVGTGSTLIAARRLGRNGIGLEITKDFASYARSRVGQRHLKFDTTQRILRGNSIKIDTILPKAFNGNVPKINFVFTCYSDDTEILTNNGWKLFKNLKGSDKVASLDLNNCLYFVEPLDIQKSTYNGDMIHINHRSLDLLVTPNHNLYLRGKKSKHYKLARADSVQPRYFNMLNVADWEGDEKELFFLPRITEKVDKRTDTRESIQMDVFLEFLGWYISEGSVHYRRHRINISQSKNDYKTEIEKCLDQMGYRWGYYDNKVYVMNNKQLYTYLAKLGKSYEKYIPQEFMNLSKRQLRILFGSLLKGDGYQKEGRIKYWTTSKKLADQVQEIAIKLGYNTSIRKKDRRNESHVSKGKNFRYTRVFYEVNIRKNKEIQLDREEHISRESGYNGIVYCCTVPSNIILVRRGGLPIWCGNSPPYWNILHKSRGGSDSVHKERAEMGMNLSYSTLKDDLGNCESYDEFMDKLIEIFVKIKHFLSKGAYICLVVQNFLDDDGKYIPMAWDIGYRLSKHYTLCQEKIWCQPHKKAGIWGFPVKYISSTHHQYCIIVRNE
jgi:DNA modification methylase